MPTYTPTQAAALLSDPAGLRARIAVALLQHAATVFSAAKDDELAYILRLADDPAGEAVRATRLIVSIGSVATPGTDPQPVPPTDTDLAATVTALWTFLYGGGA